jgi:hypothetical protein
MNEDSGLPEHSDRSTSQLADTIARREVEARRQLADAKGSDASDTRQTRILSVALEISRLLDDRLGEQPGERHRAGVQALLAALANEDPELVRSSFIGRSE